MRMTPEKAAALGVAAVAATLVLSLAAGMAIGERDARAMAALQREQHVSDCRARAQQPLLILHPSDPRKDRALCAGGSLARLARS